MLWLSNSSSALYLKFVHLEELAARKLPVSPFFDHLRKVYELFFLIVSILYFIYHYTIILAPKIVELLQCGEFLWQASLGTQWKGVP